jgi:hypothetical protein
VPSLLNASTRMVTTSPEASAAAVTAQVKVAAGTHCATSFGRT